MIRKTRKSKVTSVKPVAVPAAALKPVVNKVTLRVKAPTPGQVSLQLVKPGAKTVFVAGSFNEWRPEQTPLVRTASGRWVGNLSVLPGRHEYLFVVDGEWLPDPNAAESVQNPFGGTNSVLTVSE